ncbi:MAG: PQQ-like beta-propeller repeat protein [Fibrobacterales bacterium]
MKIISVHRVAIWFFILTLWGVSSANNMYHRDIITYQRASFSLEMHQNTEQALQILDSLSTQPSSPVFLNAHTLLGKYALTKQDTSEALTHFFTVYNTPLLPASQRTWVGTLLTSLNSAPVTFIHPSIKTGMTPDRVFKTNESIIVVSKQNELFGLDNNELTPLYVGIPRNDTILFITDTIIVHLNLSRNVITIQQMFPIKATYIYRADAPILWAEYTPDHTIYIHAQDKISLLRTDKKVWSAEKETPDICSFSGFIPYINGIAELCSDNTLIIRSLLDGTIKSRFTLPAQPKSFFPLRDGLLTVYENSLQKLIINESVSSDWNLSLTRTGSGFMYQDYFIHLSPDGTLSKINTLTGEASWSKQTSATALSNLDNKIGLYNRQGDLMGYDFDGTQSWKYQLGSPFSAPPLTNDSTIVCTTPTRLIVLNNLYFGNLPTQQERALTRIKATQQSDINQTLLMLNQVLQKEPGNNLAHELKAHLCIDNSENPKDCTRLLHRAVIHATEPDSLYNQTLKSYARLIGASWVKRIQKNQDYAKDILLDSTHYYVVDAKGITAIDLKSNSHSWEFPLKLHTSKFTSLIDSSHLYMTPDSVMHQLSLTPGDQTNNSATLSGIVLQLKGYDDILLAYTKNRTLHMIQKHPFKVSWSLPFTTDKVFFPNTIHPETIAIVSQNGLIYNINRSTGLPLSNHPLSPVPIIDVISDTNNLYFANSRNQVIARKQLSLLPHWTVNYTKPIKSLMNSPHCVLVETDYGQISCLNKTNGVLSWNKALNNSPFLFVNNDEFISAEGTQLNTYSLKTGKLRTSQSFPDTLKSYKIFENHIMITTEEGLLYYYKPPAVDLPIEITP